MQNKIISFILKHNNRPHISNDELIRVFLRVSDRIKPLKFSHVFKILNKTCSSYLSENFSRLKENTDRSETRSYAYNFQVPRLSTTTFAYTAIKDWNCFFNKIKENIKKFIWEAAKNYNPPILFIFK